MRNYQLVLVLKSALKDADRKKIIDGIKASLKDAKIKEEEWGQKQLAYVINHENSGYYVSLSFEAKEILPTDLGKKMQNNEDILRYLLLRR